MKNTRQFMSNQNLSVVQRQTPASSINLEPNLGDLKICHEKGIDDEKTRLPAQTHGLQFHPLQICLLWPKFFVAPETS